MYTWSGKVEEVSWTPRAFLLRGFLGEHEAIHLIAKVIFLLKLVSFGSFLASFASTSHRFLLCSQAKPTMTKSVVLDSVTGESQDSEVRTSTGTFFALNVSSLACLVL